MAISKKTMQILEVAMANKKAAKEIQKEIESGANPKAASVAALGVTANLVAPAVIADAAPLAGTESRLDAIEAKIDAVIAALKAAKLMA